MRGPDGRIGHADLMVGNSHVMLGPAHGEWQPMPSQLYLYVPNCDEAHRKALAAGGTSVQEPRRSSIAIVTAAFTTSVETCGGWPRTSRTCRRRRWGAGESAAGGQEAEVRRYLARKQFIDATQALQRHACRRLLARLFAVAGNVIVAVSARHFVEALDGVASGDQPDVGERMMKDLAGVHGQCTEIADISGQSPPVLRLPSADRWPGGRGSAGRK